MKLLVDTSVWSLALRRKNTAILSPEEQKLKSELVRAITEGRVAMLGLLRQEILSGIKEEAQFETVKAALDAYLDEPIHSSDYEFAARVYKECRNQGVEAGTVDILICAVAVQRGWEVLSGDGGLNRCLAVTRSFTNDNRRLQQQKRAKRVGLLVSDRR